MSDWKKIEAPMLVLSLYSEKKGASVTILSTSKRDVFVAISDSPLQMQAATSFIGTLTNVAEVCGIPFTYLFQEYLRVAPNPPRMRGSAKIATYMGPADFGLTSPASEEQRQGRRHRLSAQELVEKGYIAQPIPRHKGVGTSINWELNTATPKHNGDINEHGKDLSQFLSGWWKNQVPSWAQWLCIDGSGQVYWFEEKPAFSNYGWVRTAGKMEHGPKCNIDGHNFRELIWERKTKSNV